MKQVFPEEIGFVATNSKLAKQVFQEGIGLTCVSEHEDMYIYWLNENTQINVWTDGKSHPLSQAYLSLCANEETILHTAKIVENWKEGVKFQKMKDNAGDEFYFLTINFPEGGDLSLSNQYWPNFKQELEEKELKIKN